MAVRAPALKRRIQLAQPDLGKKTKMSKIHAEKRRAGSCKDARHGKQRAVATQHNYQLRLVSRQLCTIHRRRGVCVLGSLIIQQRLESPLAQPDNQPWQQTAELFLLRLANYRNAPHAVFSVIDRNGISPSDSRPQHW